MLRVGGSRADRELDELGREGAAAARDGARDGALLAVLDEEPPPARVQRLEGSPRLALGHGQRGRLGLDGGRVEADVGVELLRQRLEQRRGQPALGERLQGLP